MKKNQKEEEDIQRKINLQNINKSYAILYLTVIAIVIIGEAFLAYFHDFSWIDLMQDIIGNLMGVLAAFLLFDIFHERISKDSYAAEMSQQILDTIMASPEALDRFTDEQKKVFIGAAIESIVADEDTTEMLSSTILDYLEKNKDSRIRTRFDYKFELHENLPSVYDGFADKEKYFYVQEILGYDVKYLSSAANNTDNEYVSIGFLFNNEDLDKVLREKGTAVEFQRCIFRESLDMEMEDITYLKDLAENGQQEKIIALLKPDLQIDRCSGTVDKVEVKENGIIVRFKVGHDTAAMNHSIRIIFHMPKLWGSLLEVALVDPTKAPKITVSYPEEVMDVDMFSFLSKGEEASQEVAHQQANGIYDIALNTEWIYPISGMIFTVKRDHT